MLKIKMPPSHNYYVFIDLVSNINPEWMLGRIDEKGEAILNEIECEIDGTKAIIELHDYYKKPFIMLILLGFIIKLVYGIDVPEFKKNLMKKYPNRIKAHTEIAIILYKLIETA